MSKLSPLFHLRNLVLDEAHDSKKYFLGKVLTIIDASIADPEQRKGIKDLIQANFWQDKFQDRIRDILLEFSQKFCSDLAPKAEEKNMFLGIDSKQQDEMSQPSYFAD